MLRRDRQRDDEEREADGVLDKTAQERVELSFFLCFLFVLKVKDP